MCAANRAPTSPASKSRARSCAARAARLLALALLCATPVPLWARGAAAQSADAVEPEKVELRVTVSERGPRRPWILHFENVTEEALMVVADPRLLSFKAAVPGKREPVDCTLPSSMRPAHPVVEAMVELQPGGHAIRTFDPRFFCFSDKEQETLVPGTVLETEFGWPSKTKTYWKKGRKITDALPDTEPYIAWPATEATVRAPLKNVQGNHVTLGPKYARWSRPPPALDTSEEADPEPTIEIRKGADAYDERNIVSTVVLKNPRRETLTIFFRRELLTFEVLSPLGLIECQAAPDEREPSTMAFSSIRPGGSMSIASRLVELCPRGTFGRPGFYLVHARFDAIIDGHEEGVHAYTGSFRTRRPVPVRVQTGEFPFLFLPEFEPEKPAGEEQNSAGTADGKPDESDDGPPRRHRPHNGRRHAPRTTD